MPSTVNKYIIGKVSPHDVRNGEVDQEGNLHHVAPVPSVDVLVPDEEYNCQDEEEDADAEGDGIEGGEEVKVILAFLIYRVVIAGVEGELEHSIKHIFAFFIVIIFACLFVVRILVLGVNIANAEFVIGPGEVAKEKFSLMLVGNVVAM